ncbi:MAG: hypothetical protein ACI9HK_005674 [Pirellulaceae bacterium]
MIAGSGKSGILIEGDTAIKNTIAENSIFANTKIGIDLGSDGITPNDPADVDIGGNRLQNFPILSFIEDVNQDSSLLGVTLSAEPSQQYRIEFFATDFSDAQNLAGVIQGKRFIGHALLTTNAQGYVQGTTELFEAITANEAITATATNSQGDTSEFGPFAKDISDPLDIRTPVILVPGIFGSFPTSANYEEFLVKLGIEPNKLLVDPLANFYDDIVNSLVESGYTINEDLFLAPYDWRLPLAPGEGNDAVDGRVTMTAAAITDSNIQYGMDYLGHWLKLAAETWYTNHTEPLTNVKVIAHSMGGLLARSYIQSDAYGGTFSSATAGRDLALPMISDLMTLGAPYEGAALAWNVWHNNFNIDMSYRLVLSKVVDHAWIKLNKNATIQTPDGPITKASFTGTEEERERSFLRRYARGVKDLLPTYDFLVDAVEPIVITHDLDNRLVRDLNFQNENRFANRVARTMIMYGTSANTPIQMQPVVGNPFSLSPFDELHPFHRLLCQRAGRW